MSLKLTAGPDDGGRRLDRVLRKSLPGYSLSLIHRLLRQGKVLVGGKPAQAGCRIQPGSVIQIVIPQNNEDFEEKNRKPGEAPGGLPEILWKGAGIIVFNKPAGLAVHGADSLDAQVKAALAEKTALSLSFRPGPLHRLDKPTSGIIAFSESLEGAQLFSRLLREQKIVKTYLAIVEGRIDGEETWQDELMRDKTAKKSFVSAGGKKALSAIKALATSGGYSLIEARIATGRTHQIRVQAARRGHPLAGDAKYGGAKMDGAAGFFLHAWKLEAEIDGFPRPLIAPPPQAFADRREKLRL